MIPPKLICSEYTPLSKLIFCLLYLNLLKIIYHMVNKP